MLREIADDGRVVVVATHDDRIMPLADRAIALDDVACAQAPAGVVPMARELATKMPAYVAT
jgi:ABC-type lipoprotein export system ATPase subunit